MQNLPGGVPVSGAFCEEHAPEHTLKPLSCLLVLAAVAILALLGGMVRGCLDAGTPS